jgi:hypothetical protein
MQGLHDRVENILVLDGLEVRPAGCERAAGVRADKQAADVGRHFVAEGVVDRANLSGPVQCLQIEWHRVFLS